MPLGGGPRRPDHRDHPARAAAIAREAGIVGSQVVGGPELAKMTDEELARAIRSASVFARITPQSKLRLVESLKALGEIVAMTGDAVNDAPSLKAAHIGIAMGNRGTDVAREAAAIVLLDDDFGSIVRIIRLGRRIYDNVRNAMSYVLAVHVPIAGMAIVPLLFGLPIVLIPIHIAFLEMVIDPMCSIVSEAEPAEPDVMDVRRARRLRRSCRCGRSPGASRKGPRRSLPRPAFSRPGSRSGCRSRRYAPWRSSAWFRRSSD
jgi:Ca2+-transporting ATPase